ncbi:hypothetical protein GCM10027416_22420 [Okibacterium endophyticum]
MPTRNETTLDRPDVAETATDARPRRPTDRFMRKLLRVESTTRTANLERSAHRYLQVSMIISGIRCLITYLLIPIAVPIIGLSRTASAPIGLLLSAIAVVTGVISLRKFWRSDNRYRWMYTAFILVVFIVVAITVSVDISEIVGTS